MRWSFPEYENEKMNNRISLFAINSLTKDLGWSEIRNYFAMELSDKLSVKRIFKLVEEDTECLFFAYAQEGIPAIAEINYDLRDQRGQTSKDLILFKRLDTKFPAIEFQKKIESDEELTNLLNKYEANLRYAYEPTLEMLNNLEPNRSIKIYDGTCSIRFNQPENGF